MSWLFVGFIPWLLMAATFGLERLESGLARNTVSASDVDDFLLQAGAEREHRQQNRLEPVGTLPTRTTGADVPARVYIPHRPNPQFQPTRHANRV